jgi:alpha amylase-like protein
MNAWHDKLFVYEVNTWVWLSSLSSRYGRQVTLRDVPNEALDEITVPGIHYVWLMGIWTRNPEGRANAINYVHEYRPALSDLRQEDVIGSAYAIGSYQVDYRLGGKDGLAMLRRRLAERGVRLILDYVPNHVATDHPWVRARPDFIVQGKPEDLKKRASDFFSIYDTQGFPRVVAHGRDPYFPGWIDTAQLNAFNPELRQAVRETLLDIAAQCDGVRCDMAMLMTNDVFASTWRGYVDGHKPHRNFWEDIIPAVKSQFPGFMFIAEVYWNMEYALLQQGFDYAYDKTLYDRLLESNTGDGVQKVRQHLLAPIEYQRKMMRFIENHDEMRAYDRFGPKKIFPATTFICTLPGAVLLHDGQFSGRRVKLPVQIKRAPVEPVDEQLYNYCLLLLQETCSSPYEHGQWYVFQVHSAAERNFSHFNLLAYGWRELGKDYRLIVINLTSHRGQGKIDLGFWGELKGQRWRLFDVITGKEFAHNGDLAALPVDFQPYESHIFRLTLG